MSVETIVSLAAAGVLGIFVLLFLAVVLRKKLPRPMNTTHFYEDWQRIQAMLKNKDMWPMAVIAADNLLDEALKKKRFKGKTMGERLMNAQKLLADNDSAWYGHKLRNRLVHENNVKLTESSVRQALMGIRQALRDLGALK